MPLGVKLELIVGWLLFLLVVGLLFRAIWRRTRLRNHTISPGVRKAAVAVASVIVVVPMLSFATLTTHTSSTVKWVPVQGSSTPRHR